ncbi:hypothetical protein FB451DRAFT_1529069, partial [Mycena latifolia]
SARFPRLHAESSTVYPGSPVGGLVSVHILSCLAAALREMDTEGGLLGARRSSGAIEQCIAGGRRASLLRSPGNGIAGDAIEVGKQRVCAWTRRCIQVCGGRGGERLLDGREDRIIARWASTRRRRSAGLRSPRGHRCWAGNAPRQAGCLLRSGFLSTRRGCRRSSGRHVGVILCGYGMSLRRTDG